MHGGNDNSGDVMVDAINTNCGSGPVTLTVDNSANGEAYAYDSMGHYLGGPGSYSVTQGDYVNMTASPDGYYALNYWNVDGNDVGSQSNTYAVTMDTDHTVTPYFYLPDSVYLTIGAFDGYSGQIYPYVYIDGNYAGCLYWTSTFQLTPGYHTIALTDPWYDYWSQNGYVYCYWLYLSQTQTNYGNGDSIPFAPGSNTIIAYYG